MSHNRLRMVWVLFLLVFQVLFQLPVGVRHFSAFKQSRHTKPYEFVKGSKDLNYLTTLELEKIHEISDNELSAINDETLVRQGGGGSGPGGSAPSPSICEKKTEPSTFVFGKCPEICANFTDEAFDECGSLIQYGCIMQPCEGKRFRCTLRKDLDYATTICPGDKVVFEGVDLTRFQNVSLKIDLNAAPVRTDLYLLGDATGSSYGFLYVPGRNFQTVINLLGDPENTAFGFGIYRDERELDYGFQNRLTLTEDQSAFRTTLHNLAAFGGLTGHEANLVALYKVATDSSIGWRENSRKVVAYFGDGPGHEPTCVGNLKLTRHEVIEALKAKNITVVAVSILESANRAHMDHAPILTFGHCHDSGRRSTAGRNQASDIASATGGMHVIRKQGWQLISGMQYVVNRLSKTFSVDEEECMNMLNAAHTPTLPTTLPANGEETFINLLSLKSRICETVGKITCRYTYTKSGGNMKDITMEFVNLRGCPSG